MLSDKSNMNSKIAYKFSAKITAQQTWLQPPLPELGQVRSCRQPAWS